MKPKRCWFQFRLRTLLVLVALVSIAMSWFMVKWNQARRQRAIVESIVEAGGFVQYDYEFDADGVDIGGEAPGPEWVRKILGVDFFADVHSVYLVRSNWSGAEMEHLVELKNLVVLNLWATRLDDAGMKHVAGLKNLKYLELGCTRISDLSLEYLTVLKGLELLGLHEARVSDAGVELLVELKNLKYLDLSGTQVTDAALKHIAKLDNLKELGLVSTRISDDGLEYLAGLKDLAVLHLDYTRVTSAGIAGLEHRLPDCAIGKKHLGSQ